VDQHPGGGEVGECRGADVRLMRQLPGDPVQPAQPVAEFDQRLAHPNGGSSHLDPGQSLIGGSAGGGPYLRGQLCQRAGGWQEPLELRPRHTGLTRPEPQLLGGLGQRNNEGGNLRQADGTNCRVIQQRGVRVPPPAAGVPVGCQQVTRRPDRGDCRTPRRSHPTQRRTGPPASDTADRCKLVDEPPAGRPAGVAFGGHAQPRHAQVGAEQLPGEAAKTVQQVPVGRDGGMRLGGVVEPVPVRMTVPWSWWWLASRSRSPCRARPVTTGGR